LSISDNGAFVDKQCVGGWRQKISAANFSYEK
jgi:hypothetical protein